MLHKLIIGSFDTSHTDERAALAALIARIEQSVPLALLAHRTSDSMLSFLQVAIVDKAWALHVSFRLPTSKTQNQLVDGLCHSLRILSVHGAQVEGNCQHQQPVYVSPACDRQRGKQVLGTFFTSMG